MLYFRKRDFNNAVKYSKISHKNIPDGIGTELGIDKNNILFVSKTVIVTNLGRFLTQIQHFEEGIKYLDEAILLDPNYSKPYMFKGIALGQIGKPKEGIQYIKKADQLGFDNFAVEMAIMGLEQLSNKQQTQYSGNEEKKNPKYKSIKLKKNRYNLN